MKTESNPATRKLLSNYKTENVLLKASLIEKQKQEEAVQGQLTELQCRIAKLEEELELSNYHNERLTKRVKQLMEQLQKPNDNVSIFGWLTPGAVWEAIFSNADGNKMQEEYKKLQAHLEECMNSKVALEKQRIVEIEDLNNKITSLQEECAVKDKQIELLVKKVGKRQQRVIGLKKVIEEMASKIGLLEQHTTEAVREKDALANLAKKHELELVDLQKKWEPVENMDLTPEKILSIIQKGGNLKGEYSVFEETGCLEEDICKLQSILIVKLKEYKAFGSLETVGENTTTEQRPHSASWGHDEECKLEAGENEIKRKRSHDFGYSPELKDVELLLKAVECPFKTQTKVMQGLIDEYKGRITILEKKEKVLEKIMNTSFKCPSCAYPFVFTKGIKTNT